MHTSTHALAEQYACTFLIYNLKTGILRSLHDDDTEAFADKVSERKQKIGMKSQFSPFFVVIVSVFVAARIHQATRRARDKSNFVKNPMKFIN